MFNHRKKTLIQILIFFIILLISLFLFGCKEGQINQEEKLIKIEKYEDLRIATISIVTDKEVKKFQTFSDLIIVDDPNNFIGFVVNKELSDGTFKPNWKQYRECTYSIETTNVPHTQDKNIKEKTLNEYFICKGVFQINEYLRKQDIKEQNKK